MQRVAAHTVHISASCRRHEGARHPVRRKREVTSVELLLIAALAVALIVGAALSGGPDAHPERLIPVRIEAGDSLWSLARTHPVDGLTTAETAELLAEINGLGDPSLRAGAEILVPAPEALDTAQARR